jgi:hypothetical protein
MCHSRKVIYLLVYLIFTFLVLATCHFPFFWDTVQLASKHAHYFYETHFSSIILPNDIDSGHLPGLGIYLAFIWGIFGKTLVVSHLAMLPFVWGIVYQSALLAKKLFPTGWAAAALLLLLADATLLAQCTLVSPDVLVIFFFLLALNGLLNGRRVWYSIALAGLVTASMRGMMCVAGLFMAHVTTEILLDRNTQVRLRVPGSEVQRLRKIQKFRDSEILIPESWYSVLSTTFSVLRLPRIIMVYLPAVAIAGSFLGWHYFKTGWVGYHKGMPWYPLFEMAGPKDMVWNMFILGWRMVDMGRLFLWLTAFFCAYHYFRHRPVTNHTFKTLLLVFIFMFLSLSHAVILHKGLANHRYLLPVYLSFAVTVCYYLFHYMTSQRLKKVLFVMALLGMLSGNFWVYPDNIAKGWDSSLAYLPYFPLREKMMGYMQQEHIPFGKTGTPFPNYGAFEYIDLSGSEESFAIPDLKQNQYVFYSNIFNDFSDETLYLLETQWQKIKEYRFLQVRVVLYKKQ